MKTQLSTQQNFISYLRGADEILARAGVPARNAALAQQVESAELIVPVVGGFSAGKSTAINAFLGEDILSTDITPETALATELRYTDGAGYAEGIRADKDGKVLATTRLTLDEFARVKERAGEFSYVTAHLPNRRLQETQPLVLVDMPGFDAPITAHNDAISRYLERGAHFIVLQDAVGGTLPMTIKNHIASIVTMERGFSFALTKCDLQTPSNAERVAESVGDELGVAFGYDGEVGRISRGDGGAGLGAILRGIDPEMIFSNLYLPRLQDSYADTRSALQTRIAALRADQQSAQEAIAQLNEGISRIESTRADLDTDTATNAQSAANTTITAVIDALRASQSQLANAASGGKDTLAKSVGELVRSVLISEFGTHATKEQGRLMDRYKSELSGLNIGGFALGSAWVDSVTAGITRLLSDVTFGRGGALDSVLKGAISGAAPSVLATIGGFLSKLPVVGKIVAPIIAGLGGWLPAVLGGLLSSVLAFFGGKKKQIDGAELVDKIIPDVINHLKGEILGSYNSSFGGAKEVAGRCLEAKLTEKTEQIAAAQDEKRRQAAQIESQIAVLEGAIGELDALAARYLAVEVR